MSPKRHNPPTQFGQLFALRDSRAFPCILQAVTDRAARRYFWQCRSLPESGGALLAPLPWNPATNTPCMVQTPPKSVPDRDPLIAGGVGFQDSGTPNHGRSSGWVGNNVLTDNFDQPTSPIIHRM